MARKIRALLLGDAMIPGEGFGKAWEKHLGAYGDDVYVGNWESDWGQLQYRRLEIEKNGPEIDTIDDDDLAQGKDAEVLMGLFLPVSSKVFDAMPKLKIAGVSRAGIENVNVTEATKRGIVVFNVQGRNAHAVSDFAVGMMLAECRNIARAFYSIKNGGWRKEFVNSDSVPELGGRTVGLVGFGHIGRLVAKKLSGFEVKTIVYDPYTSSDAIEAAGCTKVEQLDELMSQADFVSIHARLTADNKGMIGAAQIALMKPTAYLVNTGRAGLVDQDALAKALEERKIAGAALDVFTTEPIDPNSPFLKLDNVTLTTHIAGTTADALTNSPYMLAEDVERLLGGEKPHFVVNPEVLETGDFKNWLESVRS